jgi:pyruvate carboxylase subunit B
MVAALQGTAFDTGLDLAKLEEVAEYFRLVRKKYWQFEAGVSGVDPACWLHQVPGGMISNLINQLKEQGAWSRSTRCWRRFRGCAKILAIRRW